MHYTERVSKNACSCFDTILRGGYFLLNTEEFNELAQKRCEIAISKSEEHERLEKQCYAEQNTNRMMEIAEDLKCVAEVECYKQGFKDALKLVYGGCSQNM